MKHKIFKILENQGLKHYELSAPKNLAFGDLSITIARDAKEMGLNPHELGAKLKSILEVEIRNSKVQVTGPFVNLKFEAEDFAQFVLQDIHEEAYFKRDPIPGKVMVEFSQPNTHKEFHIGHLRNASIGDALVRTLRKAGRDVIAANYFGDIGTHIAKCLWAYDKEGCPPPPKMGVSKFFGEYYKKAYLEYENNEDVKKEVGIILHSVETRKEPWFSLWKTTRDLCLSDFAKTYEYLGIKFDHLFYESDCDQMGQALVDEYIKKKVFVESEGAIICDLNEDGLGACLVRKTDGTSLYATKDLALAKLKFEQFDINESIYIVGSEQIRHFKQVFKTLEKMGFPQAKNCFHLWYDLVMLKTGKMSSRAGNAIGLAYVQEKVEEQVMKEFEKRNIKTDDQTARRVVLAALKYGMLKQDYSKKITFDIDDWLKFEGDTGPYLLYSYARMRSILRKVGNVESAGFFDLKQEPERDLIHSIWAYEKSFQQAVKFKEVNILADQAFKMCKAFNRFYLLCPVFTAETEQVKLSRINLLKAYDKVFSHCMDCLNIETLEIM